MDFAGIELAARALTLVIIALASQLAAGALIMLASFFTWKE